MKFVLPGSDLSDIDMKEAYRQSSSGNKACFLKATISASSSWLRVLEEGSFGPMGESSAVSSFFHSATVFGLMP